MEPIPSYQGSEVTNADDFLGVVLYYAYVVWSPAQSTHQSARSCWLSSWFDLIYALLDAKRAGKWLNIYEKHYRNILLARQAHECIYTAHIIRGYSTTPLAASVAAFYVLNLPTHSLGGWVVMMVGAWQSKRLSQGRHKNRDTRKVGGKWLRLS